MIRVSLPVVKQASERSSSPGRRGFTSLLPPAGGPQIVGLATAGFPPTPAAAPLEALLAAALAQSARRTGGLGCVNTAITGFGVRYAPQLIVEQEILRERLK